MVAVYFAVLVGSAKANDLCATAGNSATCSGDQSGGIALNFGGVVNSLFVQSLTLPITPVAGTAGIGFQSQGFPGIQITIPSGLPGSPLSVTTDTSVGITSSSAPGIVVTSTGGNGADYVPLVSNGGGGGAGGALTVSNAGSITTSGGNAIGISAQSSGGSAGLNAITGGGGLGGAVMATNSGVISTNGTSAYGIFASSIGGNGYLNSQDNGAPGAMSGNINVGNSGSFDHDAACGQFGHLCVLDRRHHHRNSSSIEANAGSITITNTGTITTSGSSTLPAFPFPFTLSNGDHGAWNRRGAGSNGENENGAGNQSGGNAGAGEAGRRLTSTPAGPPTITPQAVASSGMYLQSLGGVGAVGGGAGEEGSTNTGGGDGGTGGAGGGSLR